MSLQCKEYSMLIINKLKVVILTNKENFEFYHEFNNAINIITSKKTLQVRVQLFQRYYMA